MGRRRGPVSQALRAYNTHARNLSQHEEYAAKISKQPRKTRTKLNKIYAIRKKRLWDSYRRKLKLPCDELPMISDRREDSYDTCDTACRETSCYHRTPRCCFEHSLIRLHHLRALVKLKRWYITRHNYWDRHFSAKFVELEVEKERYKAAKDAAGAVLEAVRTSARKGNAKTKARADGNRPAAQPQRRVRFVFRMHD